MGLYRLRNVAVTKRVAITEDDGIKALLLAVIHGHENIAVVLLKFGVDPLAVPKEFVNQWKFRRVAAKQREMRVANWFGRWVPPTVRVRR